MTELVAPFPYYGGKRKHSKRIWELLGDVQAYVEPFCGSAAVLLGRPPSGRPRRRELINDNMGWVANFWRATKLDPETVASAMDWPNSQVEFASRQQWLTEDINAKLRSDPDWYDAKLAGVWAWGVSNAISMTYPTGSSKGQALTKSYRGANQRHVDLYQWTKDLSERLRYVQVHAGDWRLCVKHSAWQNGRHEVGIFLDPPYDPAVASTEMYDHGDTWTEVADWAFSKGEDERYRILLCGYEGSYQAPDGWRFEPLGSIGRKSPQKKLVEGLWISPGCV